MPSTSTEGPRPSTRLSPDCGWCDHPAAAHGDDGEYCHEQRDGDGCLCSHYVPKDEEPEPVCTDCGRPRSKHYIPPGAEVGHWPCSDGEDTREPCLCRTYTDVIEPEKPAEPAPVMVRAHIAVTYATAGGQLYEVLLPGGAEVSVVDGMLKVTHPGTPVLGIVRIAPWSYPTPGGEPDGADAEGSEG